MRERTGIWMDLPFGTPVPFSLQPRLWSVLEQNTYLHYSMFIFLPADATQSPWPIRGCQRSRGAEEQRRRDAETQRSQSSDTGQEDRRGTQHTHPMFIQYYGDVEERADRLTECPSESRDAWIDNVFMEWSIVHHRRRSVHPAMGCCVVVGSVPLSFFFFAVLHFLPYGGYIPRQSTTSAVFLPAQSARRL